MEGVVGESQEGRGQDSRGSTSHDDAFTMAARFDKRAMGEPIHSTSADERPSLRSFQEELQQKAKAGRELAHPRRAQDAAGLAEVADKVHELSIDEGDAPDGGDGRTLRVSSPPPDLMRAVGVEFELYERGSYIRTLTASTYTCRTG